MSDGPTFCTTCGVQVGLHDDEMTAKCNVFDLDTPLSANAVSHASEAENAPGVCEGSPPPAAPGASSFPAEVCGSCLGPKTGGHARFCEECVAKYAETNEVSRGNISVASVLLGWCNDIKRELEEFANDGPVGPMVPYRAEPNARAEDLLQLRGSLSDLIKTLFTLRDDVWKALEEEVS